MMIAGVGSTGALWQYCAAMTIAGVGSAGALWQYCHSVESADGPEWQWQYCHNAPQDPLLLSPSGLRSTSSYEILVSISVPAIRQRRTSCVPAMADTCVNLTTR